MHRLPPRPLLVLRFLAATVLGAGLAGCGGGGGEPTDEPAMPVAPLVADDGSLMPNHPRAVPYDVRHHTRAMRFATAEQAAQLEAALGSGSLHLRGDCCDAGVFAHGLAGDALFVDIDDPVRAAAVADALDAAGARRVWVVVR